MAEHILEILMRLYGNPEMCDLHDGEMREKHRWGYVNNMGREGSFSA
jgi:hypothetical protein